MASALRERVRCRRHGLAAQLDALVGVAAVVHDDAEHPSGHHPRHRVSGRRRQELEDASRSLLGGVVAAEHELGLTEPGVHRGGLRSRRLGKQGGRGLELDRALFQVPGGPQEATEALVAPRHDPAVAARTRTPLEQGRQRARCWRSRWPARPPATAGHRDARSPPRPRRHPTARRRARGGAGRPPAPPSRMRPPRRAVP